MKTFQTYITEGALTKASMSPRNNYRERLVKMIDDKEDIPVFDTSSKKTKKDFGEFKFE